MDLVSYRKVNKKLENSQNNKKINRAESEIEKRYCCRGNETL